MNYTGSYRNLSKNAQSALLGAIEIYNKPGFKYRDECFVILLLNAWELLLKAVVSKNGGSIYYPKKRRDPSYRTLSLTDALKKASVYFPKSIQPLPIQGNLALLSTYRDNAVHFYNQPGFGLLIYSLSQTSILNFRDLLQKVFGSNLAEHISWSLMPLGLEPPVDPIAYISGSGSSPKSKAVRQFISALAANIKDIEESHGDTGRLMTTFNVTLKSVKKIEQADIVVGVDGSMAEGEGPLVITKLKEVAPVGFPPGKVAKQVYNALKSKYPPSWKFDPSSHHVRSWKFYKIRPSHTNPQPSEVNEKYCFFDPTFNQYAYKQEWIDFLVKEFSNKKTFEKVMQSR